MRSPLVRAATRSVMPLSRPDRHAPCLPHGGGNDGARVERVYPITRVFWKGYEARAQPRDADFAKDVTETRDGIAQDPLKMDLLEFPPCGGKDQADRLLAVVIQMIGQVQGIPAIPENPGFKRAPRWVWTEPASRRASSTH